ncbi:iron complex outermembrane receptor protein [Leeuwenhoekiella aestuarii]|uniref:Iron complex outermembrane receptor protein n=1 Tax=Leeuwenhoekiella aestuarii TaxID=2249426 RepID=A0A4Q0P044_9FLAO|nr:TonB-dependent receptor [Leeuwenhoekiella aestuarii]RXG18341.1 iron complex outermembrane receptor protein [Leeuwenhoekiella aestuarii]RXG19646.1 iron complex outermembrane receptor protein [Leeuwenhoekiella aestuarii]
MNFKNNTITCKNIVALASIVFFSTQTQAKTPLVEFKTSAVLNIEELAVQQTITGTVTDNDGVLLPGASVKVKGTSNGTITDFDGNFSIVANPGDVLEVSYVGFETTTITVSQQTNYTINLSANTSELDEVLVVGYGTQKKSDLTGAVSSVVADEFNKGVVNNPGNLLQGKVSGLNVTNTSGEPGAGQDIIIRGVGTLRSGTSPLYVVDGFVLDNSGNGLATNPLNFINTQDIESINVLKDASAAAIYGSRAANGVVVITTKKGKAGRTQMNFSASTAISSIANKIDVFSAEEFRTVIPQIGGSLSDNGANTDWQDELTRTAITNNINFSMSGGTASTSYFASIGVDDQEGIINNSDLKRYSARANVTQKGWDDRLKVDLNLTATRTENTRPNTSSIVSNMLSLNPTTPAYTNGEPTVFGTGLNPLILEDIYGDFSNNNRMIAKISPSLEVIDGLTYKLNLGVDYSTTDRDIQYMPYSADPDYAEGSVSSAYTTNRNTLVENTLTYVTDFGDHGLTVLAGHSYQKFFIHAKNFYFENFPDNGIEPRYQLGQARGDNYSQSSSATSNELQSFFGRVNYDYKDKYLVTATLRSDGSTKFGENNRYATFPSLALGWNIFKEDFMADSGINNLKLRASWGKSGNQEIPSKQTRLSYGESFADDDIYPLNDAITTREGYDYGLVFARTANPDLQWEETTQTNIGLDFGFLDYKLSGSVDYFLKETNDVLLYFSTQDPIDEVGYKWQNIPGMKIKNSGIELALDYQSDRSRDFSYNIGGNISYIKNEITDSPFTIVTTGTASGAGQTGATINGYMNDQPIGNFFLREFNGIGADGLSQFTDVNGDGQIDDSDRISAGSAVPDILYAFYLKFKYKNFDLGLNFNGVSGNKIYNHTRMSLFNKTQIANSLNTTDQAIEYANEDPSNSNTVSTRYLENGAFLRLNNATLAYSLDPKVIGLEQWLTNVRLSVTGQNLFTITDYTGFDPELNTGSSSDSKSYGIDYFTYPKARTVVFGLNVSF